MTPELFNRWRIFPRIGMVFMSVMFVWFHMWFIQVPVVELSEWQLVQYAAVVTVYVGLWKFYFETGKVTKDVD